MAIQFSVAVRNAMLDSLETAVGVSAVLKIFQGTKPANCAAADVGTVLAVVQLASDWADAASSGAKAWSGTPGDLAANATGTAQYFRLYATDGTTCHSQGTVTAAGGGGDLIVSSTAFIELQPFTITSWSWTAGNA